MQLNRIDLNLLVVLDAIYVEGGISRAADKLFLSQPAVSHALSRLREQFDDPLFIREGRAMTPTPLTRRLAPSVRSILHNLESTLNQLEQFDPSRASKRYTIAVRDVFEAAVLPPLMRAITDCAPGIDIATVRSNRRELETELRTGLLDVAFDMLLPLPDEIHRQRIFQDNLVVVVRQNHPVVGECLSLDDYLKLEHVHASWSAPGRGMEDVELARHGLRRNIRLHCQHYFAACRVVSQTDLLLTMPRGYAEVTNPHFGNRILPFPLPAPPLDGYLYWHENMELEAANRWLRERLIAALQPGAGNVE
ncbi:MAG TPA: LysR family transcriptional regulator [Rhodocyclaceae bacterium]|nr:LysR family transcriptional regulator [Rhodocyclaceae bacterium]